MTDDELIRKVAEERQYAATPHIELIKQIMDSRIPKNEREWAASREITNLKEELERAKSNWYAETAIAKDKEIANLKERLEAWREVYTCGASTEKKALQKLKDLGEL